MLATIAGTAAGGWERRSIGPGARGERDYDWTAVALDPTGLPDGWGHWLLVRRQTHPGDGKQYRDLAFYRCRRPCRDTAARAHPRRRRPLGDRGVLPGREDRRRARPLPGPRLPSLVRPHHLGHVHGWLAGLSESWAGGSATSRRRKASPLTRPAPRSSCPRRPRATAVHDPGVHGRDLRCGSRGTATVDAGAVEPGGTHGDGVGFDPACGGRRGSRRVLAGCSRHRRRDRGGGGRSGPRHRDLRGLTAETP